jgi:hypothetical protein
VPRSSSRAPCTMLSARSPKTIDMATPMSADIAVVTIRSPSTRPLMAPSDRASFSRVTAARIEISTSGAMIICRSRT